MEARAQVVTVSEGRHTMLSLDLPYLAVALDRMRGIRGRLFAAAVIALGRDGELSDDDQLALVVLAALLLAQRREVANLSQSTAAQVGILNMVSQNSGAKYAASEMANLTGTTLGRAPILPVPRNVSAAIAEYVTFAHELVTQTYGESLAASKSRGVPAILKAVGDALDAVYGTVSSQMDGMLTRRVVTAIHQTNLDGFRDAAVRTWATAPEPPKPLRWRWRARLDERTCAACIRKHGTSFPLNVPFQRLHFGCRCMPEMYEAGNEIESGEAWMKRQPIERVQQILGQQAGTAYAAGDVRLADFVRIRRSDRFGVTYTQGSYKRAKARAERRREKSS